MSDGGYVIICFKLFCFDKVVFGPRAEARPVKVVFPEVIMDSSRSVLRCVRVVSILSLLHRSSRKNSD